MGMLRKMDDVYGDLTLHGRDLWGIVGDLNDFNNATSYIYICLVIKKNVLNYARKSTHIMDNCNKAI
jgi:hypothetical protein